MDNRDIEEMEEIMEENSSMGKWDKLKSKGRMIKAGGGMFFNALTPILIIIFLILIAIPIFLGNWFASILYIIGFIIFLFLLTRGSRKNAIIFAIVWIVIITIIAFLFGGIGGLRPPQAFIGTGNRITEGISSIFGGFHLKALINQIRNPFAIPVSGGEYEETPDDTSRPNQAFSVNVRGTESVILGESNLIIFARVNNLGSTTIKEIEVEIDLASPLSGCVVFGNNKKIIENIPPSSSKEVIFSNGYLDADCILEKTARTKFNANERVGGVSIIAKAKTMYPAASRIAVERIEQEYGELLIRNNVIRQQATGAIYRAGTAMVIDMDAGRQPIFADSRGGLMIRWANAGSGKIIGEPIFFIITPKNFQECRPSGPGISSVACNEEILKDINNIKTNKVEKYAPHMEDVIDWVYQEALENRNHVCMVEGDISEFDLMTCEIKIPEVEGNEKRITEYITTISLYDYIASSSRLDITTWCIGTESWCE